MAFTTNLFSHALYHAPDCCYTHYSSEFSKKGQRPLANLSTIFKTNEKTFDKRKLVMIKMAKYFVDKNAILVSKILERGFKHTSY